MTNHDSIYKTYGYLNFDDFFTKSIIFIDIICYDFLKNSIKFLDKEFDSECLYDDFYNNIYRLIIQKDGGENFVKCLWHNFMSEQMKIIVYDIISSFYGEINTDIDVIEKLYAFIFKDNVNTFDIYNEIYFHIIADSIISYISYVGIDNKIKKDELELSKEYTEKFKNISSPSKYDN